jgi:hypothetical protein
VQLKVGEERWNARFLGSAAVFRGAQRRGTSRSRLEPASALRLSNVLRLVFDTAALRPSNYVPHPLLITPARLGRLNYSLQPDSSMLFWARFKIKIGLLWQEFVN